MSGFTTSNSIKQVMSDISISGVVTEIVCTVSEYSDRVFIVITQINKFGTLLSANAESKADGGRLYEVKTLMGKRDDPLLVIYARQIIERLSETSSKPLLLAISLSDNGRSTEIFQGVLNHLYSNCTWL